MEGTVALVYGVRIGRDVLTPGELAELEARVGELGWSVRAIYEETDPIEGRTRGVVVGPLVEEAAFGQRTLVAEASFDAAEERWDDAGLARLAAGIPALAGVASTRGLWLVWKSWARFFVGRLFELADLEGWVPPEGEDDPPEWVIRALARYVPDVTYEYLGSRSQSVLVGALLARVDPQFSPLTGAVRVELDASARARRRRAFASIPDDFPADVQEVEYWLCETTIEDH